MRGVVRKAKGSKKSKGVSSSVQNIIYFTEGGRETRHFSLLFGGGGESRVIAGRSTTGGGTISPFHSHIKDVGYDGVFVAAPPRRTIDGAGPRSGRHGRVGPKKGLPGPSLSSRTLGAPPAQIPALPPKTSLQGVLGSSRFVSVLKRKHTSLFYENTDIIFIPTVAETSIGLAITLLYGIYPRR